jgi:hypothetical protein
MCAVDATAFPRNLVPSGLITAKTRGGTVGAFVTLLRTPGVFAGLPAKAVLAK